MKEPFRPNWATPICVLSSAICFGCGDVDDIATEKGEAKQVQSEVIDPCAVPLDTSQMKFLYALPIPGVLTPKKKIATLSYYEIAMTEFMQDLGLVDGLGQPILTRVWGYNGSYPSASIEARTGFPVVVKWINNLPTEHLFSIDHTLHGAESDKPDVRTVVHLHGGVVSHDSDGYPDEWFTSQGANYDFDYYPNIQRAAMLWFHDHALGTTRLNVYAGLAGLYLLRDPIEELLPLPKGKYEVPLVIQDRQFGQDGRLCYPNPWMPEFTGDTILVNGKLWPYLSADPRRYRLRLLNGSQARFYQLRIQAQESAGAQTYGQGTSNGNTCNPKFVQIGNEGGLLPQSVPLDEILLAPAERADVIVDFTGCNSKTFLITNSAPTPYPVGDPPEPSTTGQILQIRVSNKPQRDTSRIPRYMIPPYTPEACEATSVRNLTLDEVDDPHHPGMPKLLLNGHHWDDPITENPRLGSVEQWNLINLTVDAHPIHPHLVHVSLIERQPFNAEAYLEDREAGSLQPIEYYYTGPAEPPLPTEAYNKETVRADPGTITRIVARFGPFPGVYPWHCHILDHEDNEMMRPFEVVP